MRVGMLAASDELRLTAAEQALAVHGHERVELDVLEADLQAVGAIWIAEAGDVDWGGENALFPLISVALGRGMPLLASGGGVTALSVAGLLPGHVGGGAGGPREMTVIADGTAWSAAVGVGTTMELPVDATAAAWIIDAADLVEHWYPVARWSDGGVAAVSTANGNLVGVLGEIDLAARHPSADDPALGWLVDPTAMLAGLPLIDSEHSA